jgi:hypothetical protein
MATKTESEARGARPTRSLRRGALPAVPVIATVAVLVLAGLPGGAVKPSVPSAAHRDAPLPVRAEPRLVPVPIPNETPPWESTPDNTPAGTPGIIPAWRVHPPPPPAVQPPTLIVPANPAEHRPPLDNPGGFNGGRSPRPVPGLASPKKP